MRKAGLTSPAFLFLLHAPIRFFWFDCLCYIAAGFPNLNFQENHCP